MLLDMVEEINGLVNYVGQHWDFGVPNEARWPLRYVPSGIRSRKESLNEKSALTS